MKTLSSFSDQMFVPGGKKKVIKHTKKIKKHLKKKYKLKKIKRQDGRSFVGY